MGVVKAKVNLHGAFLAAIKVGEDELDLFMRRSLAVELDKEGKLSLGKAAEVAGVRNK